MERRKAYLLFKGRTENFLMMYEAPRLGTLMDDRTHEKRKSQTNKNAKLITIISSLLPETKILFGISSVFLRLLLKMDTQCLLVFLLLFAQPHFIIFLSFNFIAIKIKFSSFQQINFIIE